MSDLTPAERAAIEARDAEAGAGVTGQEALLHHLFVAVTDRRRLLAALTAAEARITDRDEALSEMRLATKRSRVAAAEVRALPSDEEASLALTAFAEPVDLPQVAPDADWERPQRIARGVDDGGQP